MENSDQIKKINVTTEHELTDIVRFIRSSNESAILLLFTEHSDLLVSPINLQVIQETADELEKPVIFQILDNRAGIRNVSEIGAVYTDDANPITNDLWERSYAQMIQRRNELKDALKRQGNSHTFINKEEAKPAVEEKDAVATELPKDEVIELNDPETDGLDTVDEIGADISDMDLDAVPEPAKELKQELKPKSEFSERIDAALAKSKMGLENGNRNTIEQGGIKIAVAHDIDDDIKNNVSPNRQVEQKPMSLTGKDFMGKATDVASKQILPEQPVMKTSNNQDQVKINISQDSPKPRNQKGSETASKAAGAVQGFITSTLPKLFSNKAFQKVLLLTLIPLLLIGGIAGFIIYRYTPLVNVDVYIESRPVAAEKEFSGTPQTTTFDLDASQIPVKKESVTKERSDSTNATGTASRGTKASGIVRFQCTDPGSRTIPSGTVLTYEGESLSYVLIGDVTFNCPTVDFPTGTAEAEDYGAEYNISSGNLLTVGAAGEPSVIAISETSFTGGNKEEYTVISQEDYDRVVNPLKEVAFKEARSDLDQLATDGWEIIPSSVKHELDGVVESDFPVGAEADILNVTVKTQSTALYYNKTELEDAAKDILLEEAITQDLFDTEGELDLQLGDDFIADISVVRVEGNKVTIKLTLSGAVKPSVNKDDILAELEGSDWDNGLEYLSNLSFVAQDTEVSFKPDYFPKGLRYFPSRQGRILIDIHEVEADEVITPEN